MAGPRTRPDRRAAAGETGRVPAGGAGAPGPSATLPSGTGRDPPPARLFVALWPAPRVRDALAAWRDRGPWPRGALPTPTDRLHLTLHFIGAVPAARVDAIAAGLAVPVRAFALRLGVEACWPGGTAVLQPAVVPGALRHLHADLGAALRALALPVEPRAFRPHVTLARRGTLRPPADPAEAVRWRVAGYALVESLADGRYAVVRHYR